ncbi:MAG: hypothetical protein CMJ65_06975 [Planctomycetaceae bacterium]|jgi:hypothetical protein|nr:hypothetical protein [Planctomycetaceae bacterium]MDP7276195.1 DUF1501 domain-containing protein [Planctomycetaceae bacterium]
MALDRSPVPAVHPRFDRRTAVQAGAIGLLGLGGGHLRALQAAGENASRVHHKSVIYIFLSGGLSQHESFDMKPDSPDGIRGEFTPIDTSVPDIRICEHLPQLSRIAHKWALLRSLTHPYNEHSQGHAAMLTGRTPRGRGFSGSKPQPTDHPCIASIVGSQMPRRNNLPPTVALPEKLIHVSGRVIPGQFGGVMGPENDPWFIEASGFRSNQYYHGAFPEYGFHRTTGAYTPPNYRFAAPSFGLPPGVLEPRFKSRLGLLETIDQQRRHLDRTHAVGGFDRYQQEAVSLLLDGGVHKALDVHSADADLQDRYGRNSFGWSCLMARQLIEAGVSLVQVNLGNDESWDTHEECFRNMREYLLPPTDRAVATLIEDLDQRGLLEDTLIVMAGEFGRTPKVVMSKRHNTPGRDHWGPVQTVFFAGGGVRGGTVIGATDKVGGYPIANAYKPENMAATIYEHLGIPRDATWTDKVDRPNRIYHGESIAGLT